MKLNRTIIACAVLSCLGTFSLVRAEMPTATTDAESATHVTKPRTRLESLTEKLHLSASQILQVSAVIKSQQAAEAALKADTASTADVKKAKRREIKEAHNAQIRAVLTPEQQPTFDQTTQTLFGKKKS